MEVTHEEGQADNDQISFPFRISNRGFDSIDRYLTLKNQHSLEKKVLAEFDRPSKQSQEWQNWTVEETQVKNHFRIKQTSQNLYLTLSKSSNLNEYVAEVLPLIIGQESQKQLWSFDLGQHRRFKVQIKSDEGIILYLESAQVESLQKGYETVFLLRPKAQEKRSYLQNWKFSPVYPVVTSVKTNMLSYGENYQKLEQWVFKKNSPQYNKHVQQYASSSYPNEMQPYALAFPNSVKDIQALVVHANEQKKKIVARSGGHQYSGLSSGGDDTIVVCMDNFSTIILNKQTDLIQVEPCVSLETASKKLQQWRLSVPHGVCRLVNIGGHAQTGGYGHFTRVFGLLIDYVMAFDIVLADGKFEKVVRPTQENHKNIELFRAVMGGNAGSFGIVTKFYIKGIKDHDHPNAKSVSKFRFFRKQLLKDVLNQYKSWTQKIRDGQDKQLEGYDLFFSMKSISLKLVGLKWGIMQLTLFYGDPKGNMPFDQQLSNRIFNMFNQKINIIQKGINIFLDHQSQDQKLSKIAASYIVPWPLMTRKGREFDLPYQKRGNVSETPLTQKFIDKFADLALELTSSKYICLSLVAQMITGGGAYRQKGKQQINGVSVTSIPLRNLLHTFSFDIFYNTKINKEAQSYAVKNQERMQEIILANYNDGKEKIFFWTTYGDLDMTKTQVVNKYYDSQAQYKKLQVLKSQKDPCNIFSSKLTVKPL